MEALDLAAGLGMVKRGVLDLDALHVELEFKRVGSHGRPIGVYLWAPGHALAVTIVTAQVTAQIHPTS